MPAKRAGETGRRSRPKRPKWSARVAPISWPAITQAKNSSAPVTGAITTPPATKTVPKELLPVVDTPGIELVAGEAADSGATRLVIVTSEGKDGVVAHFVEDLVLEGTLEARGKNAMLEKVRRAPALIKVESVVQAEPKGLGHAVLCAKNHVGDQSFAVLLGDDLIDARDPLLPAMIALQERTGGSVIALLEVDPAQVHLYGCAAVEPIAGGDEAQYQEVRVTGLVEKLAPADAPSNLAVIGRYVLHPAVFRVLERTAPGRGGEIQLTDALATLASMPPEEGGGVHGVVFTGRRYDTGDRLDYLKAVVRIASDREDLGPEFRSWLAEFVPTLTV